MINMNMQTEMIKKLLKFQESNKDPMDDIINMKTDNNQIEDEIID